ncbi:MAG: LysM peptidoglycan-binding domain-containing protein [Ruminococcus sp.]|nr:LysM peptidoglycan-binding domain-containing protein [Ruminococcus sp.]
MSQQTKGKHGNTKGSSCGNNRPRLLGITAWYVVTRPVNLVLYGVSWFHLYSLCQFGRLYKNIPILCLCLLWWAGVVGYGLYLWRSYGGKISQEVSQSQQEVKPGNAFSGMKAEEVKWYSRGKSYCHIFLKDKSVVTVNLAELGREEEDFLSLKLSAVNALGKGKYRLAAGIFLTIITVYGSFLVVRSAAPYYGKLSWFLEDLQYKKSVTLVHDNIYESGLKGILEDIRGKVELPQTLCLATSFNLHFASDGTIQTFDTMLYGFDENGNFTDSYLITYNAAHSEKIDIYLHGAESAVFDMDKDLEPLIEAVSVMPLKETVAAWSGEENLGILYYGMREWFSPEGIRYLNHRGESRLPSERDYYFAGYSVSVFCPDNEGNIPVRYLYVGYQEFPEEESVYVADYYPEEESGYFTDYYPEETSDYMEGDLADESGFGKEYIVKEGDTLWSIAEEMLGSSYRYTEIYNLNQNVIEEAARNQGKEDSDNGYWIYQGTWLQMPEE